MRLLLLLLLFFPGVLNAQSEQVGNEYRIYINAKDSNFRFLPVYTNSEIEKKIESSIHFGPNNQELFYQKEKVKDWNKALKLHNTVATHDGKPLPKVIKESKYIKADVKASEGRILLYFWPYSDTLGKDSTDLKAANKFLRDNAFSIVIPDRVNLPVKKHSWHFGALTIPLKVFIGAPDSVSAVQGGVSAGLFAGRRWGKKKFVNLPSEKELVTYERTTSFNFTLGLSTLSLDDKNTKDDGKSFSGSVASLTYGFAYGWHYRSFSLFAIIGMDTPLSKKADTWSLKNKPWIGFGAGFKIFGEN